jgi:hypothetical protein
MIEKGAQEIRSFISHWLISPKKHMMQTKQVSLNPGQVLAPGE